MILWIAGILGGLVVAFGIFYYVVPDRVAFVPSRDIVMTPGELNLECREVWIDVAPNQRIHAWYLPVADADKTILFCHGNGGNISHRVYSAQFFTSLGVNVFVFDYRGYGQSGGKPSERNVYADAKVAWDWLVNEMHTPPENIYLFGRSLGGAVATDLATRVPCAGLVVESSFTSAADMGKKLFPFLPKWIMGKFAFNTIDKIAHVDCPVLITHSPDDSLVPFAMSEQLFKAAREPKQFITLSGDHNDRVYFDSDIYVNGLRDLLGLDPDPAH